MQELKEITSLLIQYGVCPLKEADANSKLLVLWEGIANGRFSTNEAAAKALFEEHSDGSKYVKLISEFRNRLLEAVLEIDVSQHAPQDYQEAYDECLHLLAAVRTLTGQNPNTAALALATRLLHQAEKFDFTFLAMEIASYLRMQYSLSKNDDKKFQEANEQFETYQKVYNAENLAESLYNTLIVRSVNNSSAQAEVSHLATEYWEQIHPYMEHHASYKLQMYGYMIGLMRHTAANDHPKALVDCNEAIDFFNGRAYDAREPLQIFYYQRLISNIQLRQFEEGRASADYCLKVMEEGTFNWFKYMELYLQLSLHAAQYDQALDTLYKSIHHARFAFLPENVKEIWHLYEAYIYYLILAGKASDKSKGQKLELARFINAPPIVSEDISEINIAITVIKFLLMLQERNFSWILDNVEAVEQYCHQHLQGENTQRSYCFLKMLLCIPACGFDAALSSSKAEDYLLKLNDSPLQVANQTYEIEVIPYEHLWEIVLETLSASQ